MTATVVLSKQYVEQREAGYWLSGSRVSLDSIVYAFLRDELPEQIVQNFPTLTLEQVYGAIAFYLSNQAAIDAYLKKEKHSWLNSVRLLQQRMLNYTKNSQMPKPKHNDYPLSSRCRSQPKYCGWCLEARTIDRFSNRFSCQVRRTS
ncbi:MAG: DUF433 domain-containing protein [Leptolyngbya sp. IPPAS B-1204]